MNQLQKAIVGFACTLIFLAAFVGMAWAAVVTHCDGLGMGAAGCLLIAAGCAVGTFAQMLDE